jgi:hypothetical protein
MRKIATMVSTALAFFAIAAAAQAANVYKVSIAKVTPTKAGTKLKPKPVTIGFGYTVDNTDPSQRPSVTTDYVIGFGKNVQQNIKLFTTKNGAKVCTIAQAGYETGQSPNCPAASMVGKGVVKNKAGLLGTTGVAANCSVALTIFVGDDKTPDSTKFPNDGHKVKSDLILQLEGHPNGVPGRPDAGTCPLDVNKSALPAQFTKVLGGAALGFHVPKNPFQQPQPGVENAVVDVSSTVFKTVKVKVPKHGKVKAHTDTRGLFETVGCTGGGHKVEVTYTDTSGAVNKANKVAPCTK